jgi:hypothetical protein
MSQQNDGWDNPQHHFRGKMMVNQWKKMGSSHEFSD